MPSPVATAGFVVSRNTCPAPPVASSVADARTVRRIPSSSKNRTPVTARALGHQFRHERVVDRLDTKAASRHAAQSARPISRPVASPACRTRRTLCAASSPSASCRPRRGRSGRPSRSARARSAGPPRRARARPLRRTARRRRGSCRQRAAPGCRRDRSPPRCRPARSRYCFRPASALVRMRTRPDGCEGDRGAQPRDAAADDQELDVARRASRQCVDPNTRGFRRPWLSVRIDVDDSSRRYTITLGDGVLDRACRRCSTKRARRRAASSSRARSCGGSTEHD